MSLPIRDQKQDFSMEIKESSGTLHIKIVGKLTDQTDFSELTEQAKRPSTKKLVFDLSAVERINSIGVRAWLTFLRAAQTKYECRFSKVGIRFLDQANFIPGIFGKEGTVIEKIEIPLNCQKCG